MSSEHSGSPTTAEWIVVNTHANRDGLALRNLQRQGFETYAPQIRRRLCHARRRHDVLRPLFPG